MRKRSLPIFAGVGDEWGVGGGAGLYLVGVGREYCTDHMFWGAGVDSGGHMLHNFAEGGPAEDSRG